jgi:hypothetical protein
MCELMRETSQETMHFTHLEVTGQTSAHEGCFEFARFLTMHICLHTAYLSH